ncbi:MAG: type II toxin-antitoxin system Phd/YefM family antitoxin [Acidithiobacillus sp.]
MEVVNIHAIKAQLSVYLSKVEQGETVIIARRNKAVAELRPIATDRLARKNRPMGRATGKIHWVEDTFAPLSDTELVDWYDTHRDDPLAIGAVSGKI